MKRIIALGISSVLIMPVFMVASVAAHAEGKHKTVSETTTTGTQVPTTTEADTSSDKPDDPKVVQTRIEKRKAELKVKLTNAEKLNLQNKCKAAQGQVSSVKGRAKGLETSRSEVNENIISNLTKLSEKLKNKGIDTSVLNADIAVLKTKIATFNTDLTTYKQAVSDVAVMDCKADPDGFKASLAAARTSLENVNKDSQAIKSYVKDTIKPLLQTLRGKLDTEQETKKKGGNQ